MLARTCDFDGKHIRDGRVKERLLREKDLTLKKTDEMCQAAESTREHVSAMGKDGCTAEETAAAVHLVSRQGRTAGVAERILAID